MEVLGSEAVAVTFANRSFGMFAFAIPSTLISFNEAEKFIDLFFVFSSLRCSINLRRRQRNSANIIAPFLRRCLRRPNAGNLNNDSDPTADASTCRAGNFAGEFKKPSRGKLSDLDRSLITLAVYGLFVRIGYFRFD